MNGKNKNLKRVLPIVIISILLGSIVTGFAVPLRPMAMYGDVFVDLVPAGAGLNVYAKFGTTEIASATTNADGYYTLSITEASGVADGESIDLYVGTTYADTVTLEYENDPLEVDLYVTGGAPPEPDTGTLSVTTTPVSGEVLVNGLSWGVAPQSRTVDVGSYTVSFGAVAGYTTPVPQVAVVDEDLTTTITGTYVAITGETGTLSIVTT
ncbi:hypothetical protein KKF82_05900, partial [Patescibacteria group bacterium]|nr:hypothetical protein [Patescibacteria group bacterium]